MNFVVELHGYWSSVTILPIVIHAVLEREGDS